MSEGSSLQQAPQLFPDTLVIKGDTRSRIPGETVYRAVCRIDSTDWQSYRDRLNKWFSFYPDEHKRRLLSNFSSKKNSYYGPLLELAVFTLLRNTVGLPDVDPPVSANRDSRPDFHKLIMDHRFFFEATSSEAGVSSISPSEERLRVLTRKLNERFKVSPLWAHLHVLRIGDSDLPTKSLCSKLAKIGLQEETYSQLREHISPTQEFHWAERGWELNFTLTKRQLGNSSPFISVKSSQKWGVSDIETTLRKALERKSSQHRGLNNPYVIVLSCSDNLVNENLYLNVLYGTESFRLQNAGGFIPYRQMDGFWRIDAPAQHDSVTAVIGVTNLGSVFPENWAAQIFPNPHTSDWRQLTTLGLPHWDVIGEGLVFKEGRSLGEILTREAAP